MSNISPPLRNESLVSYASMSEEEEEEREAQDEDGGPAEEDAKLSSRQAMLIRRCNSQGSVTSLPDDPLNPMDASSEWGHEVSAEASAQGRALDPSQVEEEETPSVPRVLMGPAWEKPDEDQLSRSPLHAGALTEESLPSSASPQADQVPTSQALPRGMGRRRETWRTNMHRLMDMEHQWEQLYHQELAMWREERAQQREERARDRELQFRLLRVLTDIRDELRYLRQERTTSRQERGSQTVALPTPALSLPVSEVPLPETLPEPAPPFFPHKTEGGLSGPPAGSVGRGEAAMATRSPHGIPRRGRGRPRGSTSKYRRLFMTNS